MANFETKVAYAENIIGSILPATPYGVIGNKVNVPVDPKGVLLGEDKNGSALSLPKDNFVTVNFGKNSIIDGKGADIEIKTFDGGNESAKFELLADAYYQDGTSNRIYYSDIIDANKSKIDLNSINFENKENIAFIKTDAISITGLDDKGQSPGFEVYEIKGNYAVDNTTLNQEIFSLSENKDLITGQNLPNSLGDLFSNQGFTQNGIDSLENLGERIFGLSQDSLFDLMDLNGDQTVSLDEVAKVFTIGGALISLGIGLAPAEVPLGATILAVGLAGAASDYLLGIGSDQAIDNAINVFDNLIDKLKF